MPRRPGPGPAPPAPPLHRATSGADLAALLDLIVQRAPVGLAVIDAQGLFAGVNPAYCALYGYGADELLGQPFTRLLPPSRQAQVLAWHQDFLAGGRAMDAEWEVLHRDGRTLTVMGQSVRVPGADGHPSRLVYAIDITERKRSEQALVASQAHLQSVLDGLTAQVCVLDDTGRILTVNRAWTASGQAGGSRGAQPGDSYLDVCDRAAARPTPGDDGTPAAFAQQLREVLAGRSDGFELAYPCHGPGVPGWFLVRVSRVPVSGPLRVVVAHDDVTALRLAQDTLSENEALLRDLAASIPGAMFRLHRPPEGGWRFVYVSPGVAGLFGLSAEAVRADIRALGRQILPEDRAAHDASIRAALATGQPWRHEYRIRTPEGTLRWVLAEAVPKPAPGGAALWTGMLTDVTERKHMEQVLMASESRYRTLFETVPQGVVFHDLQGFITSANPAAQRILGLSLAQMQGLHPVDPRWQALHEDGTPLPGDQHPAVVALRTGAPVSQVVMGVQIPQRGRTWLMVNAIPLIQQGRLQEVYASFEDITERVQLSQALKLQACTDALTGAANRRSLMDRLALEFSRVHRQPGYRCALLALDLDLFKQVNDRFGHAAGDAVLQQAVQHMRQMTRQQDLVARSGGEEFIVLLPDTDAPDAALLAERLRAGLAARPVPHDGQALTVTVSIGVAMLLTTDAQPDDALARADRALYRAKAEGRNRVCVAGPAEARRA